MIVPLEKFTVRLEEHTVTDPRGATHTTVSARARRLVFCANTDREAIAGLLRLIASRDKVRASQRNLGG